MTLGSAATEELGSVVRDLLYAGKKNILIDLGKVAYIDSASLGVLVAHLKLTVEKGGAFKLLGPNEQVTHMLTATKLELVFEIFPDEASAVASF